MIRKPSYQTVEAERDDLRVIVSNLHKCLSAARVALRNGGLYPYPGRTDSQAGKEAEAKAVAAWMSWISQAEIPVPSPPQREERMPKLNSILQRQLEEDEYRARTEFLPDDLDQRGWQRYIESEFYLALLRWGGGWNNDLHKEKSK